MKVLPNGNFVVVDTGFSAGGASSIGAVYLYQGTTLTLISTLKGSTTGDKVGSGFIIVLTNGNYVVSSPNWVDPTAQVVGAVTWCSATLGCSGVVSASNSLIGGTNTSVALPNPPITVLTNGNYVVSSPTWDNPTGPIADAGAVTWGNGLGGTVGLIASSISVLGTTTVGISTFAYDTTYNRLVVGRGASNLVSILYAPNHPLLLPLIMR